MTIQQLLQKLEARRDAIESAIFEIRQSQIHTNTKRKAAAIVRSIQPRKRKKYLHWTQKPENRDKLMKMVKANARKKSARGI